MSVKNIYRVFFSIIILYWPSKILCQPAFSTYNIKAIKDELQINSNGFLLYKGFRGFVWIGGADGVSRYDGRNFTNYTIKDGLTQNYISDIEEDQDWNLYVASHSGISIYNGDPILPFKTLIKPAQVMQVTAIVPEHLNKIWIADEVARTVWLLNDNKLSKIEGINENVYEIVKDKAGIIYALSRDNSLFIIKNERLLSKVSVVEVHVENELCKRLEVDINGNAFLYSNTLKILSAEKPYLTLYNAKAGEAYFNVLSVPAKGKKRILYKSENAKWLPVAELHATEYENSSIYVGNDGKILYTGDQTGLYLLTPKIYTQLLVNKLLLYGKMNNEGAKILKLDSALFNNKLVQSAYKIIGEKYITNLFKGKDKTVWFCTTNGLYFLIQGKGPLKQYSFKFDNQPLMKGRFVDAVEGKDGKIWFRTYYGLVCYDGKQFLNWNSSKDLQDNTFFSMAVNGDGKLYSGANSLYAEVNGKPVNISKQIGLKKGDIFSMSTDKGGNVWICPNYNILYQIKQNNNGDFYKSDSISLQINGLPLTIKSIAFDNVGNLWAAGINNMLIYLIQPSGKFSDQKRVVLTKPQFLEDQNDERMSLNTNEDKTIIYLRNTAFNAAEVIKNFIAETPKLVLTDVRLNNKKTNWWLFTDSVNRYGIPTNLVLKAKENNLSFHYTSICIGDGFFTQYTHKLEGLEDEWQPLSGQMIANYTNLSAGDYTFYLKSINQNGPWSEPIKFSFTIEAIWYKTTQAIILWFFLIALLSIAITRYRINKIKYKVRIDKLLIEHQLKALRAQINPHFIQNSLEFLMQSIERESPQRIHNIIEQLSLYLRNILSMSDKTIVTLEDELEFSEEYLSINKLLFNRDFTYTIDIDPAIDTFSIKIPAMLLQPFLENALKYGVQFADKEQAVIDVQISRIGRFISCKVTSNYPSAYNEEFVIKKHVPKGLLITEERLALLYPKEKLSNLIFIKKENNKYIATICIPV